LITCCDPEIGTGSRTPERERDRNPALMNSMN